MQQISVYGNGSTNNISSLFTVQFLDRAIAKAGVDFGLFPQRPLLFFVTSGEIYSVRSSATASSATFLQVLLFSAFNHIPLLFHIHLLSPHALYDSPGE